MNRRQEELIRACKDLGLRIEVPFSLMLSDGTEIQAEAFLPELGSPNGMVVVKEFSSVEEKMDEIADANFGCSVLDEPSEEFDLESYKSMFADWSWWSKDKEPEWMKNFPIEDES